MRMKLLLAASLLVLIASTFFIEGTVGSTIGLIVLLALLLFALRSVYA